MFQKTRVTVFAYGQPGSGKTYTMKGVTQEAAEDIFATANKIGKGAFNITMSFYEIYGGKAFDLLNEHARVAILEDKNNSIQIQGLVERPASSPKEMLDIISFGHKARTTHQTVANDTSSRSHAICQVLVYNEEKKKMGRLILVDLAGSERAQDT
jgi:kinesin family protein 2/24